MILPITLTPLTAYPQFLSWRLVNRGGPKPTKEPVRPDGSGLASVSDPSTWCAYRTDLDPLGFVFTEGDQFFFLDVDGAYTDGQWSPLATALCERLAGAAVEVSQSGTGLHIIGTYTGGRPAHSCRNTALGLELYTANRFVALTGTGATGDAGYDCTDALASVIAEYFPPATVAEPPPAGESLLADEDIIQRACRARSGASTFGGRASFSDLWTANGDALAQSYPDASGARPYDESSADAALAQHLAFWTGRDPDVMTRIMWQSDLIRDKWNRPDYIPRTVAAACAACTTVYEPPAPRDTTPAPVMRPQIYDAVQAAPAMVEGFQYLDGHRQCEHFAQCVYVRDLNRIWTPTGDMLEARQFNAVYGGYVFSLDSDNDKSTRRAWEAFTESQVVRFPKCQGTVFDPQLLPGAIVMRDGRSCVNTYVPIVTERLAGDPGPFLDHLARVLPVQTDREILLAYMAACVQHIGVKFQWAPLVQGTEGNGKTLFTRCVAHAIGRRYTHFPKAMDLDNKFNAWLRDKLFIGVEDIYVPDSKREVLETLKPYITGGDGIEIQAKGADQVTVDVCANFFLNSNHKDAILKTESDRRFAVFYTAQQSHGDIVRDGMDGDYFPRLYAWLRDGGYAIVNDYLQTYQIPDALNPATGCHRAPTTSSTAEAVMVSLGGIEQEVQEAIAESRPGFAGGWVSSVALATLLERMRATRRIPPNKRRAMLQALGYDYHPGLDGGRATRVVFNEGKPRLFIADGHLAANLTGTDEIIRAYERAQSAVQDEAALASFGAR